jgi:peptidoglycan hydrolase-like protein with peptidoglycan-binding domain
MPTVVKAEELKPSETALSAIAEQKEEAKAKGRYDPAKFKAFKQKEEAKEFQRIRSDPKQWRGIVAMTQMTLGRLGYGTGPFDGRQDEKTRSALRQYQVNNRLPTTGDLDMDTLKKVFEDEEVLESVPVSLPFYYFSDQFWDSYVFAEGTWVIENDKQAFPLQATSIHCNRQWNHCIDATAEVMMGNQLFVDIDYYEVERWDEHEIVTKPKENLCTRYTLRLSRSQKTVTGLRITTTTGKGCESIEEKDLTLRLVSGLEVYGELLKGHAAAVQHRMQMGDFEGFKFKE